MSSLSSSDKLEYLLSLPLKDLMSCCKNNKQANEICRLNDFWIQRFLKDYPNQSFDHNNARQEYISKYTSQKQTL